MHNDYIFGCFVFSQFADFTELRAPSAEKASFYFDAALNSRTRPAHEEENSDPADDPFEKQNSNMIFTFHVYQYMIDKVGAGDSTFVNFLYYFEYNRIFIDFEKDQRGKNLKFHYEIM